MAYRIPLLTLVVLGGIGWGASAYSSQPASSPRQNGASAAVKSAPNNPYDVERTPWPLALYDAPPDGGNADASKREQRLAKNKRYDSIRSHWVTPPKVGQSAGWDVVIKNTHWQVHTPPIPAQETQLAIVGTITASNAFLSESKGAVYTEHEISIESVLYSDNEFASVAAGTTLTADRLGGDVRYPGDYTIRYLTYAQGMPEVGKRYVFFLKARKTPADLEIITGYEVSDDSVIALDGSKGNGAASPPFDKYNGITLGTGQSRCRGYAAGDRPITLANHAAQGTGQSRSRANHKRRDRPVARASRSYV